MENAECLATKTIMENKAKVGYMFREPADYPGDTGWRIFTGEESLDFIDKDDNIEMYPIAEVIKHDPAIEKYLDLPIGTELERVGDSQEFAEVPSE
jgi:hypothetical protein